MKSVWRYTFKCGPEDTRVNLPMGCELTGDIEILSNGEVGIFALVDPSYTMDNLVSERTFFLVATGMPYDEQGARHIGSAVERSSMLRFRMHLFEREMP